MAARETARRSPRQTPLPEQALRLLAVRDRTERELREALLRRGHPPDGVDAVIARLRGQGLLDDAACARRAARRGLAERGVGSRRIRQELGHRGVERGTTELSLSAALEETSEAQAIDKAALRYWHAHRAEEPVARARKLWAHLVRRGFPPALVSARVGALAPGLRSGLVDAEAADAEEGEPVDE
jgi:regulatory protein